MGKNPDILIKCSAIDDRRLQMLKKALADRFPECTQSASKGPGKCEYVEIRISTNLNKCHMYMYDNIKDYLGLDGCGELTFSDAISAIEKYPLLTKASPKAQRKKKSEV